MRLVFKRGGGGFYAVGWRTSQAGREGILWGCTCCISAPLPLCCTQCLGQTTCNWGTVHTYLTRINSSTIIIIVMRTSLSSSSILSSSVGSNRISLNNVLWLFFMTARSTFHYSHHIYTCQPAMLPLFWCLDTGRLRVSDVSSFRSRHVACTGCPRNCYVSSNLILLITHSVFLYPYKPAYYTRQIV